MARWPTRVLGRQEPRPPRARAALALSLAASARCRVSVGVRGRSTLMRGGRRGVALLGERASGTTWAGSAWQPCARRLRRRPHLRRVFCGASPMFWRWRPAASLRSHRRRCPLSLCTLVLPVGHSRLGGLGVECVSAVRQERSRRVGARRLFSGCICGMEFCLWLDIHNGGRQNHVLGIGILPDPGRGQPSVAAACVASPLRLSVGVNVIPADPSRGDKINSFFKGQARLLVDIRKRSGRRV